MSIEEIAKNSIETLINFYDRGDNLAIPRLILTGLVMIAGIGLYSMKKGLISTKKSQDKMYSNHQEYIKNHYN